MIILSIQGVFRTILIIIAVLVIMRFIGKLMIAKRNLDEERAHDRSQRAHEQAKKESELNKGKIHISKVTKGDVEDVDFEEIT
jgi:uncharacterized membrane protein